MLKLTAFMLASSLLAQNYEYHSSVEVSVVKEPIFATSPVALDGEYAIINAYTGQALGSQEMFGHHFAAQFEVSEKWRFTATRDGRYQISNARGSLSEVASDNGVHFVTVGAVGSAWDVQSIDGAETFVIRSVAGNVLEVHDWRELSGEWVTTYEQNGGSNQEWRIVKPTTIMTAARSQKMSMRGSGQNVQFDSGAAPVPSVKWSKDGDTYTYRVKITDPNVIHVKLNRYGVFDTTEVQGQPGWRQIGAGWIAKGTVGIDGDLALSTAWGPGPVIIETRAGERLLNLPETLSRVQRRAATDAGIFRGSHAWGIGPVVAPNIDTAGVNKLAERMVLDGLAFLHPLVKATNINAAFRLLRPANDYERLVVETLRPQLENIQ